MFNGRISKIALALSAAASSSCTDMNSVELGKCRFEIPSSQIVSISNNLDGQIDQRLDRVFEVNIHYSVSELEASIAGKWARAGGAANGINVMMADASSLAAVKRYERLWSDIRDPNLGMSAPEWDDEAEAFRNYWTKHKTSWVLTDADVTQLQSEDLSPLLHVVIAHCHETPSSKVGAFDCLRNLRIDGFNASYRIAQQNIEHRKKIDDLIVSKLREWEQFDVGSQSCFHDFPEKVG